MERKIGRKTVLDRTVPFTVSIPGSLHETIDEHVYMLRMSRSAWALKVLREAIENYKPSEHPGESTQQSSSLPERKSNTPSPFEEEIQERLTALEARRVRFLQEDPPIPTTDLDVTIRAVRNELQEATRRRLRVFPEAGGSSGAPTMSPTLEAPPGEASITIATTEAELLAMLEAERKRLNPML